MFPTLTYIPLHHTTKIRVQWWKCRLWSCGLWCHVILYVVTSISEEHMTSISRINPKNHNKQKYRVSQRRAQLSLSFTHTHAHPRMLAHIHIYIYIVCVCMCVCVCIYICIHGNELHINSLLSLLSIQSTVYVWNMSIPSI